MTTIEPWSIPLRLHDLGRDGVDLNLEADEATRARIAKTLDLAALHSFSAKVRVKPWLDDGAEVEGRWSAGLAYTCGLSLEPFDSALKGVFSLRCVPEGSPHAVTEPSEEEIELDSDDPPDVLEGETMDIGGYLVEHLALDLDPFPRKPGVVFEQPPEPELESPFAVLLKLRPDPEPDKG